MAIRRTIISTATVMCGVLVLQSCAPSGETTGNGEQAATVESQVSERAREKALQHFIDGSIHEMKGNYAQAIIEYQDALRYDPNHAVFFALSKCYSRLNKHALAIESGMEAVRKAPDNVDYLRNLGDAYAGAYQIDSAAAVYERVVALDPDEIQSWYTLAGLYQGRRPLKSLETYEGIIERFGDEWEVLLQIADLYNAKGEPASAAAAMERMLTIDPGNVGLMRSLAQTYVRAQDYDNAIRLYTDLRERDPENLDFLGEIATVHLLRREYIRAAELFDLVLERDSVSVEAKLQIGEAYFSQVQGDSALLPVTRSMFRTIRNTHPDDWRPYWFLGALGGMEGDDSLTMVNFRRVTELAPWNPDGWVYLSSVYLQNSDFAPVVPILEEARKHV
ncbi:MAG: tetratricopeptide repeat protein, partial [Ignavibacteria bacterium]|nr:tetratricopeptide repeat protein [Ignavibacteria bacterium]